MSAVLNAFESQLTTRWEALTPADDGSSSTFVGIDTRAEEQHHGDHRQFIFEMFDSVRFTETNGLGARWRTKVVVFFRRRERTRAQFRQDVATDVRDLIEQLRNTTWADGVIGVLINEGDVTVEVAAEKPRTRRAGGIAKYQSARVEFPLEVLTDET